MSDISLYRIFKDAGVEIDHHESDLYVKDTPDSRAIIAELGIIDKARLFYSQNYKGFWYEFPFAFDPFWEDKAKKHKHIS